jgi:hypothetical protein
MTMVGEGRKRPQRRPKKRDGGKPGARRLKHAVTAEQRQYKAFQLKVDGLSIHEIALRLGCSVGTVHSDIWAVREELAENTQKLAAREREVSLARIERAIAGIMDRVDDGDSDAILSLDRMEKRRAALLGLDAPTKQEVQLSGSLSLDELDELKAAVEANGCSPPATSPEPASPEAARPSDGSGPSS